VQIKATPLLSYHHNNTTPNYRSSYKTTTSKTAHTDPTKTFQSKVRNTINKSKILIPKESRWKYTNMNPSAPTMKGLIKVHKPNKLVVF